jgi:flagellar hook assembly protein FlgD
MRYHSPDGHVRVHARRNEAVSRRRRARRVALCTGALALVALTAAWAAPRVSAGAAAWLAAPTVRGSQISVTVGSAATSSSLNLRSRAARAPDATGRLSPGWVFNMVGVVYVGRVPAGWQPPLQVRTSQNGTTWTAWQRASFEPVGSAGNGVRRLGESLFWVGDARFLEYRLTGGTPKATVRFTFMNTLGSATLGDRVAGARRRATAAVAHFDFGFGAEAQAAVPQPTIVTRAQWGADESWRTGTPDYAPVRMAIVHHTVNGNDYTQEQAPGLVRAIYYYHTKSEGFRDIGYNFLIDRYGTIYEGRYGGITLGPVGAQTLGFNTGTTGISIIGNFQIAQPTSASLAALEYLLAWKLDVHHIDPLSTVSMVCGTSDKFKAGQTVHVPAIVGHRDLNYTACPGDYLYAQLANVRAVVADRGLPKIYGYLTSDSVISPNGDGLTDITTVTYTASEVVDWTVSVAAADGTVVRGFAGNGQDVSVVWDGLDANGALVPDGAYTVTGTATSPAGSPTAGSTATAGVATVVVDTKVPTMGLVVRSASVNPEGTGVGDSVSLSYQLSEPGSVQVVVKDAAGAQVRQIQAWTLVPAESRSVSWDGKVSQKGKLVPAAEGQYTIEADGKDLAGNPCSASGMVTVDRTVRVTAAQPIYLSPNGDGRQDAANVTFELRRSATVSASVLGSDGSSVLTASLGSLPTGTHTFQWKGKSAAGKLVRGGAYSIVLSADSGQGVVQAACGAVVDLGGPSITAGHLTIVKRRRAAATNVVARDKQSAKVHLIAIVKSAQGKVVTRVDCGWVVSGTTRRFTYKASKPGVYAVWFSALDQAGNRQVKVAIWRLRVKK